MNGRNVVRMRSLFVEGLVLLLVFVSPVLGGGSKKSFPEASVRFEQNATDSDFEVVFEVGGTHVGLRKLSVVSPDGHQVIDFSAQETPVALGIRTFVFESPEPSDLASLKAAYPQGVYTFTGTTVDGILLESRASLGHQLPPTAKILHPEDQSTQKAQDVVITWKPLANVAGWIVEIEQEELDVAVKATLQGSATSFAVPDDFLIPEMEYKLAIGTVARDGNISFVETSFTTEKSP